jgi:hypothetical protein
MKNPLEEYLEKKAAPGDFMSGIGKSLSAGRLGRAAGGAILGAGTAGAVGLAGMGAQKLVDAATKARDFKNMLAFDAELAAKHEENPRLVNQMFSTLRAFNPALTKDPATASAVVMHMTIDPAAVAGQLVNVLPLHDRGRGGLGPMMMQGALGGAKPGGGGGKHSRDSE